MLLARHPGPFVVSPFLRFPAVSLSLCPCCSVRVAHELAHSWTGNLVTNASMDHFWLNEGFTVYAERRILEATEGPERVAFHAAIGYAALLEELRRFGPDSEYTKLRMNLQGQRNAPDGAAVACEARLETDSCACKVLEETCGAAIFPGLSARSVGSHLGASLEALDHAMSASGIEDDCLAPGRGCRSQKASDNCLWSLFRVEQTEAAPAEREASCSPFGFCFSAGLASRWAASARSC